MTRFVAALVVSAWALGAARAQEPPSISTQPSQDATTGALRFGIYNDTDKTTVIRTLAQVASSWGNWSLSGSGAVDIVSSASVDVRSSPALSKVDTVTGASGTTTTTGGKMTDDRLQVTGGAGWNDHAGHALSLGTAYAAEHDYQSLGARANGSFDLFERTTTLLGGIAYTSNSIGTVLDPTFHRSMWELGWSVGIAQVATPSNAFRLRYDGSDAEGYQASPYRNVRFGDWITTTGVNGQIMFSNTLGSADGLPETEPLRRVRHAGVLEWVHALSDDVALHLEGRVGRDTWGVQSEAGSIELRVAEQSWRMQLGYRFYTQSAADFFLDKYTLPSAMYTYYTSDKELGRETGHMGHFDVATVLVPSTGPGDTRLLLDGRVVLLHYDYPGFLLLESRTSYFIEVGLTWEL